MTTLKINGEDKTFDAPDDMPLLWALRDVLGMTGTKFGCGIAQCGACTVHIDGKPVRSCLLRISTVGNRAITTIEGDRRDAGGARVQKAWLDLEVIQCGYCQSGQIMSAAALLAEYAAPGQFRYRCRHGGQYLSLRHLCAHPGSHQARRGRASRKEAHDAFPRQTSLPRRRVGRCSNAAWREALCSLFAFRWRKANEIGATCPRQRRASSRPMPSSASTIRARRPL